METLFVNMNKMQTAKRLFFTNTNVSFPLGYRKLPSWIGYPWDYPPDKFPPDDWKLPPWADYPPWQEYPPRNRRYPPWREYPPWNRRWDYPPYTPPPVAILYKG